MRAQTRHLIPVDAANRVTFAELAERFYLHPSWRPGPKRTPSDLTPSDRPGTYRLPDDWVVAQTRDGLRIAPAAALAAEPTEPTEPTEPAPAPLSARAEPRIHIGVPGISMLLEVWVQLERILGSMPEHVRPRIIVEEGLFAAIGPVLPPLSVAGLHIVAAGVSTRVQAARGAGAALDRVACLAWIEGFAERLFSTGPAGGVGGSPTWGGISSPHPRDDLAVGPRRVGRFAGGPDDWAAIDSWQVVESAVFARGAGSVAFVLLDRPYDRIGHVVAVYHTTDLGVRWVDFDGATHNIWQTAVGSGLDEGEAPYSVRAILVDPRGGIVAGDWTRVTESASTAGPSSTRPSTAPTVPRRGLLRRAVSGARGARVAGGYEGRAACRRTHRRPGCWCVCGRPGGWRA